MMRRSFIPAEGKIQVVARKDIPPESDGDEEQELAWATSYARAAATPTSGIIS
jgi:hypothetical protein